MEEHERIAKRILKCGNGEVVKQFEFVVHEEIMVYGKDYGHKETITHGVLCIW